MATLTQSLPMSALVGLIRDMAGGIEKAKAKAVMQTTMEAHDFAVRNAKAYFNNTKGRVRTGQLTNSIYQGYDEAKAEGFIASRLVYARILEYGGTIKPVYAKHLWVKNHEAGSRFKRMTPREFMSAKQSDPDHFSIFKNPHTGRLIAAYNENPGSPGQAMALFTLRDSVTLKSRPYMLPAAQEAMKRMAGHIKKYLAESGG